MESLAEIDLRRLAGLERQHGGHVWPRVCIGGGTPVEALLDLRRQLDELSPRHRWSRVAVPAQDRHVSGVIGWKKSLFDRLEKRRESIEAELEARLEWSRLDEGLASRIALAREGSIHDNDRNLEQLRGWMLEWLHAFKWVFGPVVDELGTELE